jgi:hypothetical protein
MRVLPHQELCGSLHHHYDLLDSNDIRTPVRYSNIFTQDFSSATYGVRPFLEQMDFIKTQPPYVSQKNNQDVTLFLM